jgi:hypothetical protein
MPEFLATVPEGIIRILKNVSGGANTVAVKRFITRHE